MRPADLWRHSSFRLALGVTLAVLGALIMVGAVGYTVLHRQLADRQDARLMEIFTTLQQSDADDKQDLVEAIAAWGLDTALKRDDLNAMPARCCKLSDFQRQFSAARQDADTAWRGARNPVMIRRLWHRAACTTSACRQHE